MVAAGVHCREAPALSLRDAMPLVEPLEVCMGPSRASDGEALVVLPDRPLPPRGPAP